jgi:hypothetical protein
MANTKTKKVFSISSFRGLDKENKPLKVEPSMASDGYNFDLGKGTLKTRPALQLKSIPSISFEEGEFIIGHYLFRDINIYVTNNHIYINDGNLTFNETDETYLYKRLYLSINIFKDKEPLFIEEKDCLFIFCLENIYVFSILNPNETREYVLYDFKKKPANTFSTSTEEELYKGYNDLPTPYEPTIWLGNDSFEDVNLLSKKFKYKVFANTNDNEDGYGRFLLPTHYETEKHGGYDFKIDFYKNIFGDIQIFPVFMGILEEDFDATIDFGISLLTEGNEIEIKSTFHPEKSFVYTNETTPVTISEIVGLDKNTFFEMETHIQGKTVFEYLIDYIKTNSETLEEPDQTTGNIDNHVIAFTMPTKFTSLIKDATDDSLVEEKIDSKNFIVYVQLRYYDDEDFTFTTLEDLSSEEVTEENGMTTFPDYPTSSGLVAIPDHEFELDNGEPIYTRDILFGLLGKYSLFINLAMTTLETHKRDFTNDDVIRIKGKFYTEEDNTIEYQSRVDGVDYRNSFIGGLVTTDVFPPEADPNFTPDDMSSYPETDFDPIKNNPNNLPVLEHLLVHQTETERVDKYGPAAFDNYTLREEIENIIIANFFDVLPDDEGSAFLEIHIVSYNPIIFGSFARYAKSVIPFTYSKKRTEVDITYFMQSFVREVEFQKTALPVSENLYSFNFDINHNAFDFRVRNFLYDYRNEPSIDIEVEFTQNPDYDLIRKMKFGTTFGTENRLFLTGHEDYKNIDRYNVSNDLLGDNVKNQSYELSYFPSKNYRILGGKGAINGYAIATDNQLYVTKEDFPNDSKFFIRKREIDDNGQVSYYEYKTNIKETPLNKNCIVRFNNDILLLSKKGLFGIELSNNIQTDERLIKPRDRTINETLVKFIKENDNESIFIVEDNLKMYIFIGKNAFIADSRYLSQEKNALQNIYYEFVYWKFPQEILKHIIVGEEINFLDINRHVFYTWGKQKDFDEKVKYISDVLSYVGSTFQSNVLDNHSLFEMPESYDYVLDSPEDVSFILKEGYYKFAEKNTDFTITNVGLTYEVTILDSDRFVRIKDGDTIYVEKTTDLLSTEIYGLVENGFQKFYFDLSDEYLLSGIYALFVDVKDKPLYIHTIYKNIEAEVEHKFLFLLPYPSEEIDVLEIGVEESDMTYANRVTTYFEGKGEYLEYQDVSVDSILKIKQKIEMLWVSGITDFNNNLYEKTIFKTNLFFGGVIGNPTLHFGYKTYRGHIGFNEAKKIEQYQNFDFNDTSFGLYSLSTFGENGVSFPSKINNFLYIRLMMLGLGYIELNEISVIYKDNRILKSIG